ncbi:MAG: hypothetical protein KF860_08980 [Cyclobacteriaceae bacterium]|nr:hypothetical protein [Cyclobacteriaceae bacterium]
MNMKLRTISIWALALAGGLQSCQTKESKQDDTNSDAVATVVSTDVEPDQSFENALVYFAQEKYDSSANSVEHAASFMEQMSNSLPEKRDEAIDSCVADLRDLATSIATDHVYGIGELNYYFGKTGRALAGYTMTITDEKFTSLTPKEAGLFFQAAIDKMEKSARYHQRELSIEESGLLERAKNMRDRLEKGEAIDKAETLKMISELRAQLDKWELEFKAKHDAQK